MHTCGPPYQVRDAAAASASAKVSRPSGCCRRAATPAAPACASRTWPALDLGACGDDSALGDQPGQHLRVGAVDGGQRGDRGRLLDRLDNTPSRDIGERGAGPSTHFRQPRPHHGRSLRPGARPAPPKDQRALRHWPHPLPKRSSPGWAAPIPVAAAAGAPRQPC